MNDATESTERRKWQFWREALATFVGVLPWVITGTVAAVGWGISVETRLRHNDDQILELRATVAAVQATIGTRLDRIEGKIDTVLLQGMRSR